MTRVDEPRSVLVVAVSDRDGASSRVRAWGVAEALRATGRVRVRGVVGPRRRSLIELVLPRRYDVVLLQKWVPPAAVLRLLRRRAELLVYDCDDAIYLDVPQTEAPNKAASTRSRFRRLLAAIDGATVSTALIAEDIGVRAPRLPVLVYAGPRPPLRVGSDERSGAVWLGSPDTEPYLWPITDALRIVEEQIGFVAMGATRRSEDLGIRVRAWSMADERALLQGAAVGLFLQREGEWERRKAGYKILEYIASGVLPVAERSAAAVEILGEEYPFYVDGGGWAAMMLHASTIDAADRQRIIDRLRARTDRLAYDRVAQTWTSWVATLPGRASSRSAAGREVDQQVRP